MSVPRIVIHVDELVVHGFERSDARDLGEMLRSELETAFAPVVATPIERDVARIDAGIVRVPPGARNGAVASATARAIHSAVTAPNQGAR